MNTCKVLGGVTCLMVLLGTGALAGTMTGKPGTSGGEAAKAVQSITQQGEETISHRSLDALSIQKFEQQGEKKRALIGGEALEKEDLGQQGRNETMYYNDEASLAVKPVVVAGRPLIGGEAMTEEDHGQQGRNEQLYFNGVAAKASENFKEKAMKTSQKVISTQSSH